MIAPRKRSFAKQAWEAEMKLRDSMSTRTQLFCVWCGPAGAVLYLIFWAGIAKFVPPPSPHWTQAHIANFFASNRTGIRIGQIGGMVASMLFFPFFTVIAVQIAQIEKRRPILAMLEFAGGLMLIIWFGLCTMLWIVATFRTDLSPNTIQMLNDFAWLIFVMLFPEYVMQMLAIGIAALRDKSPHPVWPRWAGYFNCWIAFSGVGGGLAVFFKHGPFAWNGLIGFWVPLTMFGTWLAITTYLLHTGIKRQAAGEAQEVASLEAAVAGSPAVAG
jgi:hypothetical protein